MVEMSETIQNAHDEALRKNLSEDEVQRLKNMINGINFGNLRQNFGANSRQQNIQLALQNRYKIGSDEENVKLSLKLLVEQSIKILKDKICEVDN